MKALIDADTPIYNTALVSEDTELSYAKSRLDFSINKLIEESGCTSQTLFVSGGKNFRYEIDPTYKGNRADKPTPKWREDLRLHLIKEWGAVECVGYEADDACGFHQNDETIIVAIDKDLLQVPGRHYQWAIIRKGVVVRPAQFLEVSEVQGLRSFFKQMLTGDVTDNIFGIRGIGPKKAQALIDSLLTEQEMYDIVLSLYGEEEDQQERFKRNLDLLWIWRELGITYNIRKEML